MLRRALLHCISSLASLVVLLSNLPIGNTDEPKALLQAHAHNDYLHDRPLLDAISFGFNSVEADIFLIRGKLLVAHTLIEIKEERTLESLYLKPLRDHIKSHGGKVFENAPPFHLMIDIKGDAVATYAVLEKLLADYSDIVSIVQDGVRENKAVDVVLSGNRPIAEIAKRDVFMAGIDGRLNDLDSDISADRMPLISDNWGTHFKWRGKGPMNDADLKKLREAVGKAHQHGRKIRFWGAPDTKEVWGVLKENGVDRINTDDLQGLSEFLRKAGNIN